jgi:hypothetical protein
VTNFKQYSYLTKNLGTGMIHAINMEAFSTPVKKCNKSAVSSIEILEKHVMMGLQVASQNAVV